MHVDASKGRPQLRGRRTLRQSRAISETLWTHGITDRVPDDHKNLDGILAAIQTAKAPAKFTRQFLAGLGYKSSSDRLVINVLKALGFLSADGVPTQRYFNYLDQTQAERVMAEAVMDAYEDLFEVNTKAQELSRADLKNKMRTLSQRKLTDAVLDKLAMTFKALADHGDFAAAEAASAGGREGDGDEGTKDEAGDNDEENGAYDDDAEKGGKLVIDGLVYNIQIQLPESRDPKVYDALFQSLKKHLGR